MNFKKTALALIVVSLTFSIGFVTFKAAEIIKNLVTNTANCSRPGAAPCSAQRENISGREIPLR